MTATAKPGHEAGLVCPWCTQAFRPRRRGRGEKFCRSRCRLLFWAACRTWAERAVALGIISIADLKADPAACTPRWGGEAPLPCPDIPSTDQPSCEPLKWFVVEVSEARINALIFRDYAICPHERADLIAIMGALLRLRHKPRTSKTPEGMTVFSF
jgi:hypothetical protein